MNINANKKLINIICEYSAKKNNAKDIDEYSTLYPDTNSDSPSVKSKGALLVSAKQDIKNINPEGNKGKINHIVCS
tara:strand:+ start:155 stop:382 length:228 start_codon:yes stop_codon:yes gene_type:complete